MAATEQKELKVAGLNQVVNAGGEGAPVMVLHRSTGLMGWGEFESTLAATHHTFVPDLPGYGHSERPDWAREPRDLAIMTNSLAHGLELTGVTLVGMGFGGFIAAELATMRPAWLERLVLVGAAGVKPAEGQIMDQMLMAHADYVKAGFADEAVYLAKFGEKPDADVRDIWEFSRIMTARVCWSPYMFSRRLAPLLTEISVPTTVVHGSADAIIPRACADQYAAAIPDARLEVLEAGHFIEFEQPAALAACITRR